MSAEHSTAGDRADDTAVDDTAVHAAPHRLTFAVGDDHVGVLRLDRPDKLNAMDSAMFAALHDAAANARSAVDAGECRAVLMVGAGRAFSAGTDLGELGAQAGNRPPRDAHIAWLQQAFSVWEDLPVPVVAAIHGVALGAGCQLALAADLRVMASSAQIGVLEVRWGIVPDLGASYRLPPLVGRSRAIDMAVRGRKIDAPTALAWGLADEVVDDGEFGAAAHAVAAEIAAGPVLATATAARLMREADGRSRDEALTAERTAQAPLLRSEDFAEAVRAGLAGERPVYQGR